MKIGETTIVLGKRVTVGAAITSTGTAIAAFYPNQAIVIMALTVPITLLVQVAISHFLSITTKEQ